MPLAICLPIIIKKSDLELSGGMSQIFAEFFHLMPFYIKIAGRKRPALVDPVHNSRRESI